MSYQNVIDLAVEIKENYHSLLMVKILKSGISVYINLILHDL